MTQDTIRVVVIGASFAGINAAQQLMKSVDSDKVRLTVIDKRGHFYYTPGSVRSPVSKDFAEKVWISLDQWLPHTLPHRLIQGCVSEVHPSHVLLQETEEIYSYDYLIVSSGVQFSVPFRFPTNDKAEGIKAAHAYADNVAKATKVLIVGGGPTGVELAGEIKDVYPDKEVTLVHGGDWLLSDQMPLNFRRKLTERVRDLGIKLILNDRLDLDPSQTDAAEQSVSLTTYHTRSGIQLEADWLVSAIGAVQVQTQFMDSLLLPHSPHVFHPETHALRVLPTMQLAHPDYPHIFVPGDANDFPCIKSAYRAGIQGEIAGENLAQLIKHRLATQDNPKCTRATPTLREFTDPANVAVVTLGSKAGLALLYFGFIFGNWLASKVKGQDLLLWKAEATVRKPVGT
ncbi:hypothetical protein IWQ62_002249 [Dispira parvispora]|uniref:FAD/NAD(P)-binding domain-containing protein n=1 Tax=Dispira parvispora TaxID=1520584 RepID=A0A9W8AQQ5_9FUNG|nr:hypothetical protein IWQ62_002249 [Dispira parvispora]